MRPTHYTDRECFGIWRRYPESDPFSYEWLDFRGKSSITLPTGLLIHALAFGDPAAGIGNFPRWDCINGMNSKQPMFEEGDRPPRVKYYLKMASLISSRSTCDRAKVGAVLTNHHRVVGTGYNGGPKGTPHCIDNKPILFENDVVIGQESCGCITDNEGRCITTIHAELNAILSREGQASPSDNLIMYCTHQPCRHCYKAMVQYGVKNIYYIKAYEDVYRDKLAAVFGIPMKGLI